MTTTQPRTPGPPAETRVVDMGDERLMRDPFAGYSRIREEIPVTRGALPPVAPVWMVTRHADVAMVLEDPRFAANPANIPGLRRSDLSEEVLRTGETPAEYITYRASRMGQCDGPDHARLRASVSTGFSGEQIAGLRPRIEEITAGLLDRLAAPAGDPAVDLLAQVAQPLADTVLGELIGIPEEDHARWWRWCTEVKRPHLTLAGKAETWRQMVSYAKHLIQRRRAEPAGDLISAMVEDGVLTDVQMISVLLTEHNVHLDCAALIANGVDALLAHPRQFALLGEHPGLASGAAGELARFCGPVTVARMRHAAEDLRLGGVLIRKGEAVWPVLAAADRDPRAFPDPDRLDITRRPGGAHLASGGAHLASGGAHLAFGGGPHRCLGAGLAHLMAEVALGALARRFPRLTLAVEPAALDRKVVPRNWSLRALPVRLT